MINHGRADEDEQIFDELVEVSRYLLQCRRENSAQSNAWNRSGDWDTVTLLNKELRKRLGNINSCIYPGFFLPFGTSTALNDEILAFVPEESVVLQTPHKVHFLAVVEVRRRRSDWQEQSDTGAHPEELRAHPPYIRSLPYEALVPSLTSSADLRRREKSIGSTLAESFVVVKEDFDYEDGRECQPSSEPARSADALGEEWVRKRERIRESSPLARRYQVEWDCRSIIVKSYDDLRQDQLASELLFLFDRCYKLEGLNLPLRPYAVVATSEDGGVLETLTDAVAIDTLKKRMGKMTLAECFEKLFGGKGSMRYHKAQELFIRSMAGYSVFCYVLHVKDRHNGNIMLCRDGAVAHVDFGIMLNVRYAKDMLEMKIKLSSEFVQVSC